MARVTADEVRQIMDDTDLTDINIESFISGATALMDSLFGSSSTSLLKEIERWLSAHLIACTRERQALKEEAGSAKVTYTGEYGQGLHMTSYGQMAMSLDITGKLAALMMKAVKIYAIPSFQ